MRKRKYIVERYEGNPILTPDDMPYDIHSVTNSSVVKMAPDKYVMVSRTEDSGLARYLWVSDSKDGLNWTPRPEPMKMPQGDPVFDKYCRGTNPSTNIDPNGTLTYLDPRITCIEGQYYITHAAHTSFECQLGLFKVDEDFEKLEWMGLISMPDNRNGVLFPEKIGGKYHRLERCNKTGNIWTQSSPDLIHWGVPRCLLTPSDTGWAYTKVGGGAVPIKTEKGWLCIIHGVRLVAKNFVYGLGAMMLDLEDPTKLLAVSKREILAPREDYEKHGQTPDVVFTNGAVLEDDGTVKIYYGGADTVQCVAFAKLDDLIDTCFNE